MWLSKLGVDTSIGWTESAPPPLLVEIGLRWLPKLGADTSPRPQAHRRTCYVVRSRNPHLEFRRVKVSAKTWWCLVPMSPKSTIISSLINIDGFLLP